jgi:hypothetical protein
VVDSLVAAGADALLVAEADPPPRVTTTVFVTTRAGAETGSSCTGRGIAGATVGVTRDPSLAGGTGSNIWDRDAGAATTGSGTSGRAAMVSCDVQAGFAVAMANMRPAVVAALSAATTLRDPAARCVLRVFVWSPVRSVVVLFLFVLVFVFFVFVFFFFVFVLVVIVVRTVR